MGDENGLRFPGIARVEVHQGKIGLYRAHSRQTLLIGNRSPRLTAASTDRKIAQLIAWVERVGV